MLLPDALFWDAKTSNLYFTDIYSVNATICRLAYDSGLVICTTIEGETFPSFIIPMKCCKNLFAVGLGHSVKMVRWSGVTEIAKVVGTILTVESGTTSQMNKGVADPKGRLYTGTFNLTICGGPRNYGFYRYTSKNKSVMKLFDGVHTTTGLTFDKNKKKLYHLDGCHAIVGFDWDCKTGNLCKTCLKCNFHFSIIRSTSR